MDTIVIPQSCSRYSEQRLLDIFTGVQPPTEKQFQYLVSHYMHCDHCQRAVTVVLDALSQSKLLRRRDKDLWVDVCRTRDFFAQARVREQIPSYVETWIVSGCDVASQRYPRLAAHLKKCRACARAVKTVKALIQEAEDEGIVAPLAERAAALASATR